MYKTTILCTQLDNGNTYGKTKVRPLGRQTEYSRYNCEDSLRQVLDAF